MNKKWLYISLGEFGYATLLRYHLAYLKKSNITNFSVLCDASIKDLYSDLCETIYPPLEYKKKYEKDITSGWFPFNKAREIKPYLSLLYEDKYNIRIPSVRIENLFQDQAEKIPIKYTNKRKNRFTIIVCSRVKNITTSNRIYDCNKRNIPKQAYIKWINSLCKKYQNCDIVSIGIPGGSFNFPEIKHNNFYDRVGKLKTVQDTINEFNCPCAVIASQSAFSFLCFNQHLSVFTIGENEYLYTRQDLCNEYSVFYNIGSLDNYSCFNFDNCYLEMEKYINDRYRLFNMWQTK